MKRTPLLLATLLLGAACTVIGFSGGKAGPAGGEDPVSSGQTEPAGEAGENLTGQEPFTLRDLADWGYPYGLTAYDFLMREDPAGGARTYEWYISNQGPEEDQVDYNLSGVLRKEDPAVSFQSTGDWPITGVLLREGDGSLGPRGLCTGMRGEDALALFRCEAPEAAEYLRTLDESLLGENRTIRLYWKTPVAAEPGQFHSASLYGEVLDKVILAYQVSTDAVLNLTVQDNTVTEIYMSYSYDSDG